MLKIIISALLTIIFSACIYSQDTQSVIDLRQKGLKEFQNGSYDKAIADLTRAIELTTKLTSGGVILRNGFVAGTDTVEDAALRDRVTVIDPRTAVIFLD